MWLRLLDEFAWAFTQGDLPSSEQWAIQAFEAATASSEPDAALLFGAQLLAVRLQTGPVRRARRAGGSVRGRAGLPRGWRAAAALLLDREPPEAEARDCALAEDFQSVRWDAAWSAAIVLWAEVCSSLGLEDRAGQVYELLAPFSGQLGVRRLPRVRHDRLVARNSRDDPEALQQAEIHFAAAAEIDERLGSPLLLARTRGDWARALITRGQPEDLDRAQADARAGR